MRFDEFDLDPYLLDSLASIGYEEATPVQVQAIPVILDGNDLIACAQTGTGKTGAFLIPMIEHIMAEGNDRSGTKVLIIVPTRELAGQIDQNMEALSYFTGVSSVAVYGGSNSKQWDLQKNAIDNGVDVIIATPGRFKMHYKLGYMDLSKVHTVILDEADKMLDMGFHPDIVEIISYLPKGKRQTLMFSATMPSKIRKLAKEVMQNQPKEISLALSKPAEGVDQRAYVVFDRQKKDLLKHLLKNEKVDSMIIFASSKLSVDGIASTLRKMGFDARPIHSDRDQSERQETLNAFKNKQFPIVVATDVLSRGIDIDSLSHVLNFDVPMDAEDYVHRIGRTARANTTGTAMTFINPDDMYRFGKIEALIEAEVPKQKIPEELGEVPTYSPTGKGRGGSGGGGGRRGPGGRSSGGGGRSSGGGGRSSGGGGRSSGGGGRSSGGGGRSSGGGGYRGGRNDERRNSGGGGGGDDRRRSNEGRGDDRRDDRGGERRETGDGNRNRPEGRTPNQDNRDQRPRDPENRASNPQPPVRPENSQENPNPPAKKKRYRKRPQKPKTGGEQQTSD